jgi:hypothetical protein
VLRIRDIYPGSRILIFTNPRPGSRIPDPKTATKKGEKKFCCHTFFCSHKFHKTENYFIFKMLKKKKLGKFSKNYRTFYPKFSLSFQKYGFGNPDPGVKKASDPGSGSATL